MLVLMRKDDETIIIEPDITVRVLSTRSGHVKLGIIAPVEVRILRGELHVREAGLETMSTGHADGRQAIEEGRRAEQQW